MTHWSISLRHKTVLNMSTSPTLPKVYYGLFKRPDRRPGCCHGNPSHLSAETMQQTNNHSSVQVQHVRPVHGHFHETSATCVLILRENCSYQHFVALSDRLASGAPLKCSRLCSDLRRGIQALEACTLVLLRDCVQFCDNG
jgi:hypothetical protein